MPVRADVLKQVLDFGGLDLFWLFDDLQRVQVTNQLTTAGAIERVPADDVSFTWLGYKLGPGPPP